MTIWENSIEYTEYHLSIDNYPRACTSLGIDAGTTHLGFALINMPFSSVLAFEVKKEREPSIESRINTMLYLIDLFSDWKKLSYITVEGASYMDRYRQVELEDVRASSVCWKLLHESNTIIQIPPPLTIRKTVFGSGKIKNPWKEQGLPDNAAAALGCALYPIFKEENETKR